ncbi:xylose isomerase-like protein [Daldinia bambusicola]|nr:xylose isomerase-like protein [Daldinia bambusicola]
MEANPFTMYPPAITCSSLGDPTIYPIEEKLKRAALCRFTGVEISFEEVLEEAKLGSWMDYPSSRDLESAASRIHKLCRVLGLEVVAFGPIQCFEGLRNRVRYRAMKDTLSTRFQIAKALGTKTIIVTANHLRVEEVSEDYILSDLKDLSDFASKEDPSISIAYSFTCHSTFVNKWKKAWDIVKSIDRSNFGICLNTFQVATALACDTEQTYTTNLAHLVEIPLDKVLHVQVSGAAPLTAPLIAGHPWYHPRESTWLSWSKKGKRFPFECPNPGQNFMEKVAAYTIRALRYKDRLTFERSTTIEEKEPNVPADCARRGMIAWYKLKNHLG